MSVSVAKSNTYALQHLDETTGEKRKLLGQFFTPPSIAEFMADLLRVHQTSTSPIRLLDPGAGTGILGIAAARSLVREHQSVTLTAFEIDRTVTEKLASSLSAATDELGARLGVELIQHDFLVHTSASLFAQTSRKYDAVISNPPYFKTSPADASDSVDPNIYARFMRRSGELLNAGGTMVFIVPRSFMSGFYFRKFRAFLRSQFTLERVHVFDSRRAAFRDQSVLQENVIVVYRKCTSHAEDVDISVSAGTDDLASASTIRVPGQLIYQDERLEAPIRLPTTLSEVDLLRRFADFPARLATLGMEISTGPVVPFRATQYLDATSEGGKVGTVPLLWLQHVSADGVSWPLLNFRKPQKIVADAPSKLRAPNKTCVLIRRFSAKEDRRRLVAGTYLARSLDAPWLGLENHLNFIYRPDGELTRDEAQGLAYLLNSQLYDAYFRICNGNTQVGATDIRELPLPPLQTIERLGRRSDRATDAGVDPIDAALV